MKQAWKRSQDVQPIVERENSCRWEKQKIVAEDQGLKNKGFKDKKCSHIRGKPNDWALS